MKRSIAFILASFLLLAASCGGKGDNSSSSVPDSSSEPEYGYVSLLSDKKFERGFDVRGLGRPIYGDEVETFGPLFDTVARFDYEKNMDKAAFWQIHQWATRYPFHDKENTTDDFNYRFTDQGGSKYLYENRSKTVGVDTSTGEFRLGLKASECYVHGDRTEGQEWPHLLVACDIGNARNPSPEMSVAESSSVKVHLEAKLNSYEDKMTSPANPNLHSAICMFYLYVSHRPEGSTAFTDMMWLGFTVFDNRSAYPSGMSGPDEGTKDSATGKWIYNVKSTEFVGPDNNFYDLDNNLLEDKWVTIDIEMMPHIMTALADAQRGGLMKGATLDTLYINGMYVGFELPGTYDLDMSFRNLDITSMILL